MIAALTIIKYPKVYSFFALLAMALFRVPLQMNKTISFYKLMGCGKNGSFDTRPDWQQWAILTVYPNEIHFANKNNSLHQLYGNFITKWLKFFKCNTTTYLLDPVAGHGLWDGKMPFGSNNKSSELEGKIAVLTRATIRLKKIKAFWQNVDNAAAGLNEAKGFICSYGIGEMPFIKQATFSIWRTESDMKNFAYQNKNHQQVIQKTRKENWYSEEMFFRFKIIERLE